MTFVAELAARLQKNPTVKRAARDSPFQLFESREQFLFGRAATFVQRSVPRGTCLRGHLPQRVDDQIVFSSGNACTALSSKYWLRPGRYPRQSRESRRG
ncbi:hypothetical protein [Paraburkholderia sp. CI3]|uniref:hypothetical protein n=1 Tax=Paraburkholderia sp. CI3 TaxID=2991060 RepID=UPI003D23C3C0